MLARSRWASNYYITPATGSSDQLERRCWNENHTPAEAGPPGPQLSSPGERERKAVIARKVRGSICCSSVQSPTHLSHTILSIKWEVYFSKELCFVRHYCVDYVSACICVWLYMYHGYVTIGNEMEIFITLTKYNTRRRSELVVNYLASLYYPPYNNVRRVYKEWDILINLHR